MARSEVPVHLLRPFVRWPLAAPTLPAVTAYVEERRRRGGVIGTWTARHPRRAEELAGGSVFFVRSGRTLFRLGIEDIAVTRTGMTRIAMTPFVYPVVAKRVGMVRGWRYLEERDAPADLPVAPSAADDRLPEGSAARTGRVGPVTGRAARRMPARWARGHVEWIEDEVAHLSVVFTWDLERVWQRANWLHRAGYRVRVGGPAVHVRTPVRDALAGIAEIGGHVAEAVVRHNPDATFASRGCPVGCWFCVVPSMEGREFTLIEDFVPRPILCDNNLSALPGTFQDHIVARYQETEVPLLDANSGFEPRTFDEEVFRRWEPVLRGPWRFALDDEGDLPHVLGVLDMLRERVPNPRRKRLYVLVGNEPFDLCMHRIRTVLDGGAEPHVQPLMKLNAMRREPWVRHDWSVDLLRSVARWANRRLWKYTDFDGYRRSVRSSRQEKTEGQMSLTV